jgi:transcriptional regulator with XRE-family HTH domain
MLYDNEKIRSLMLGKDLSGNGLAKLAGISGPSMHAILNGVTKNVRYQTLAGIAAALGVPIQAISKAKHKGKRDLQSEAMNAFGQLSQDNQSAMLATMLHLAAQQKK